MVQDDYNLQTPSRGLLLGACAGLSDRSGFNPMLVRGAAIVAMCIWFKLAVLAYCVTAIYFRIRR